MGSLKLKKRNFMHAKRQKPWRTALVSSIGLANCVLGKTDTHLKWAEGI